MYQNQTGSAVPSSKVETLTESVTFRFSNLNDESDKFLSAIEEKLHCIYNQREPKAENQGIAKPMESDFISRFETQVMRVDYTNIRLQKILSHFEKIV